MDLTNLLLTALFCIIMGHIIYKIFKLKKTILTLIKEGEPSETYFSDKSFAWNRIAGKVRAVAIESILTSAPSRRRYYLKVDVTSERNGATYSCPKSPFTFFPTEQEYLQAMQLKDAVVDV